MAKEVDKDHGPRKLTNIRPREVSLVDSATNERDYLVVKRDPNAPTKEKTDALETEVMKRLKDIPVEKRLALAVYKLDFWKDEFPTEEDVKKFFRAQGISDDTIGSFTMDENDWRFTYKVNDKGIFEESSLGQSWAHFSVGVDGSVGILKRMSDKETDDAADAAVAVIEHVAKAGKKISGKRLKKLRGIQKQLNDFLDEFDTNDDTEASVSKQVTTEGTSTTTDNAQATEVEKLVNEKIAVVEKKFDDKLAEKDVKIAELQKALDAKKPAEGTTATDADKTTPEAATTPAEGAAAATTETPATTDVEAIINKRLEAVEKSFDEKLAAKDVTITALEKRLGEVEDEPGNPQGEGADSTTVEKNAPSMFGNILQL